MESLGFEPQVMLGLNTVPYFSSFGVVKGDVVDTIQVCYYDITITHNYELLMFP